MHLETKRIETKRLILRPFCMEDAPAMYRNWASDPEVTKYLSWPSYTSETMAEMRIHWMMDRYREGNVSDWAIVLKDTGYAIGSIGAVSADESVSSVHVGYCIGKAWWHQGITSEALWAVLSYFFEEAGVLRVEARYDAENPNSGAVMRKCGMSYEGTLRASARNNRGIRDAVWYAILKDDYWKRKQAL